jgi:LysM repeat protein
MWTNTVAGIYNGVGGTTRTQKTGIQSTPKKACVLGTPQKMDSVPANMVKKNQPLSKTVEDT